MIKLILLFVFLVAVSESTHTPLRHEIDLPVDKSLIEYMSWWETILGSDEEPEEPLDPVDPSTCPACECGQARLPLLMPAIVNGSEVKYVNQYPWMGQLRYNGRFYCGCSLINSKYVLTAAHCVHHFDKKHITVRLLEHDRNGDKENVSITRKVDRVVKHKNFSIATLNNDIALLRLDQEVKLGKDKNNPSPVCLPEAGKTFNGMDGLVTGWGTTKSGGSSSNVLLEVTVPIMSNEECKKTAYGDKRILPNMLCAGHPEGGKDSCQGDSGGPLKVSNSSIYSVVGVVSWGIGCAEKNYPGVYTRVNRYLDWIHNNTIDACPCPHKPTSETYKP